MLRRNEVNPSTGWPSSRTTRMPRANLPSDAPYALSIKVMYASHAIARSASTLFSHPSDVRVTKVCLPRVREYTYRCDVVAKICATKGGGGNDEHEGIEQDRDRSSSHPDRGHPGSLNVRSLR